MTRRYEYPIWTPRTFNDRSLGWLLDEPVALRGLAELASIPSYERLDFDHRREVHRTVTFPTFTRRESDLFFQVPWRTPEQEAVELYLVAENESAPAALDRIRTFCITGWVWQEDLSQWERSGRPRDAFRPLLVLPMLFYTAWCSTADRSWNLRPGAS